MQGTDSHGQSSEVSVGGSLTKVSMGPRGSVDHCRGNLF
jgi:hypothetical protein